MLIEITEDKLERLYGWTVDRLKELEAQNTKTHPDPVGHGYELCDAMQMEALLFNVLYRDSPEYPKQGPFCCEEEDIKLIEE